MKKVCIFSSVHPVFEHRSFHKIAKTLKELDYDITIIGLHNKSDIVDGIKIIGLPEPKNRFFRILGTTWKAFYLALKEKADIYHFYDPEMIFGAIILKIFTRGRVIYDVREDYAHRILTKYWIPKILRRPIAFIFGLIEKMSCRLFDCIITPTLTLRKKFEQFNVVDVKNYPVVEMFSEKLKKAKKDEFHLIYAGALAEKKGIRETIQALDFINPRHKVKLKLLGNFSEPSYEKEVKKISKGKNVEFLGHFPYRAVYGHMENSDAGLMCSLWKTGDPTALPVKLFEYMAASLPIISANFPLWREIIESNGCGICVSSERPEEIGKAVEYLIEHPKQARKMGKNGRKAILEKYNWKKESRKLIKVYEKLLKS